MAFSFEWDMWRSSSDRTQRLDSSGAHDLRVRSSRVLPSEGVMASLSYGAITRRVSQPWLRENTSGDFVSMLESAWEPSISHMRDSDHPIV